MMKSTALALLILAVTLVACAEAPVVQPAAPPPVALPQPAVVNAPVASIVTVAPVATVAPSVAATTAPPAPAVISKNGGATYVACGCGCCGGVTPKPSCLYHSKGDDLQKIIAADRASKQSPTCRVAGCSMGTSYSFCD